MAQEVALVERNGLLYSVGVGGLVLAALATDVVALTGANNRVVRVLAIIVGGFATAAAAVRVDVVKRATANTGGTATNPAGVLRDAFAPNGVPEPARAILSAYTANPATLGTSTAPAGGIVTSRIIAVGTASAPTAETFIDLEERSVVLRSATDVLALNLNGVTVTGGTVSTTFIWTEQ